MLEEGLEGLRLARAWLGWTAKRLKDVCGSAGAPDDDVMASRVLDRVEGCTQTLRNQLRRAKGHLKTAHDPANARFEDSPFFVCWPRWFRRALGWRRTRSDRILFPELVCGEEVIGSWFGDVTRRGLASELCRRGRRWAFGKHEASCRRADKNGCNADSRETRALLSEKQ